MQQGPGLGDFETALICENGHVLTSGLETSPEQKMPFCSDCSAATLDKCPNPDCGAPITGHQVIPGIIGFDRRYRAPNYCGSCGGPFPWTARRLEAAQLLAAESELPESEQAQLAESLRDVTYDGPRTQLAVLRIQRLLGKVSPPIADAVNKFAIDVASETAKKLLTGE